MKTAWIESAKKKPTLGMETVVKYGNGKKEIVFWTAKLVQSIQISKIQFSWIELPTE